MKVSLKKVIFFLTSLGYHENNLTRNSLEILPGAILHNYLWSIKFVSKTLIMLYSLILYKIVSVSTARALFIRVLTRIYQNIYIHYRFVLQKLNVKAMSFQNEMYPVYHSFWCSFRIRDQQMMPIVFHAFCLKYSSRLHFFSTPSLSKVVFSSSWEHAKDNHTPNCKERTILYVLRPDNGWFMENYSRNRRSTDNI